MQLGCSNLLVTCSSCQGPISLKGFVHPLDRLMMLPSAERLALAAALAIGMTVIAAMLVAEVAERYRRRQRRF